MDWFGGGDVTETGEAKAGGRRGAWTPGVLAECLHLGRFLGRFSGRRRGSYTGKLEIRDV